MALLIGWQVMAKTIFNPYGEAIESNCEELDVAGRG